MIVAWLQQPTESRHNAQDAKIVARDELAGDDVCLATTGKSTVQTWITNSSNAERRASATARSSSSLRSLNIRPVDL